MPEETELQDLGWANGWPNGEMPEIARKCMEARARGEPHAYSERSEFGSPYNHEVRCETCGYFYKYDSD